MSNRQHPNANTNGANGAGAGADPNKTASAAAMDALNLDDLFLGGEDDDAQGGMMADSLFADMDIDLGDIMEGIIGDETVSGAAAGGGVGGGGSAGIGDLLTEDFGSVGGPAPSPGIVASSGPSACAPAVASKGKGKARTARSNPHLAAVQQQQPKPKQSSLSNEAKLLQSSIDTSQILSPTAKRKRRKSKKIMDEDEEQGHEAAIAAIASSMPLDASKKSRKSSSVKMEPNAASSDGIPQSSAQDDSSSTSPDSAEDKITQQPQLQQQNDFPPFQHPDHTLYTPASSQQPTQQIHQQTASSESFQQSRKIMLKQFQKTVANFGLSPSTNHFFPYIQLPLEVDVKKRGHKLYPLLEKLHMSATVSSHNQGGGSSTGSSNLDKNEDTSKGHEGSPLRHHLAIASIDTTSSIYKLFDQHVGALMDNHGTQFSPFQLQSALEAAIRQAAGFIKPKKRKKHHPQLPTSQNQMEQKQQESGSQTQVQVVEELSKLYLGCMRQSCFLRQNLWNMERWSTDHWNDEDVKTAFGTVKRVDVEWAMRMMKQHKERERQRAKQEQKERRRLQEEARQRQLMTKKKMVNYDKNALPSPKECSPNEAYTHGGPASSPLISVRVKVKVAGWRDKSGSRLNARLWCPGGWKLAMKQAHENLQLDVPSSAAAGSVPMSTEISFVPTKLDLSPVDMATMETLATELVRPDLMPKRPPKNEAPDPPIADVLAPVAAKETSASELATHGVTAMPNPLTSDVKVKDISKDASEEKKKVVKKRKTKEGDSTNSNATSATVVMLPRSSSGQRMVPHVPSHAKPPFPTEGNDMHGQQELRSKRILEFLHTQILHPSLSAAERRALLANKVSLTQRELEGDYLSSHEPWARRIQKQIEESHSVYLEDKEIVPENCNTIGMWNWINKNNDFDNVEPDEVYKVLGGCWQPELDEGRIEAEGGYWGRLQPPEDTRVETAQQKGSVEGNYAKSEPSHLFNRLQSLLVEIEESDDEGEFDDDLIASLPSFSLEELIYGPKRGGEMTPFAPSEDEPDDGMLDVSALAIDQRTYVQLRAVGLLPSEKRAEGNDQRIDSSPSEAFVGANHGEPIDAVLSRMKSRLSRLHAQTNADVVSLQHKALSHISRDNQRKRLLVDDESIIAKYKQLAKSQSEQREEKQRTIRTSGRVKTGSNKFDGEHWLPW